MTEFKCFGLLDIFTASSILLFPVYTVNDKTLKYVTALPAKSMEMPDSCTPNKMNELKVGTTQFLALTRDVFLRSL
jgi:hypothetical protein